MIERDANSELGPTGQSANAVADARADDDGMPSASTSAQANAASRSAHNDAAEALQHTIAGLDADGLSAAMAMANARLDQHDPRKIREDDVKMLHRLAGQAHDFDSFLIEHADARRRVGEHRGPVSPEAAHTAEWATRLTVALDALFKRKR